MVKGAIKYRWIGVLTAVFLGGMYLVGASGLRAMSDPDTEDARADIIEIRTLRAFGNLTKPEVIFLHDAHTEALEKMGKDCSTCHLPKSNKIPGVFKEAVEGIDPLSPKFKRLEDTARREVMDVYHTFCIGCHTDMLREDRKTGPITCGGCHAEAEVVSNRLEMGLDRSLHYRHSKAHEDKCETCHHAYDEEKEKLFYDKGAEGSCRYCHGAEREEKRIPFREAAHLECIACHRQVDAMNEKDGKDRKSGPVHCAGCHGPEERARIEKVPSEDIPRMKRNQPAAILIGAGLRESLLPDQLPEVRMASVAFDHERHEVSNDTCRACHHASLEKCSDCHTPSGDEKGDYIPLAKAFHQATSQQSCIGCHREQASDPKCAGCHDSMSLARKRDDASCLKCHDSRTDALKEGIAGLEEPEDIQRMVRKWIDAERTYNEETYPEKDIPEKVVIKRMMDQYEAVELPHRKIVNKLMENIRGDRLAAFHHDDPGTLCQGCHHNSPPSPKPPTCASCHARPFDPANPDRPGLLAAYHRQCMGCHQQMGIEKPTGCTGCHKKK